MGPLDRTAILYLIRRSQLAADRLRGVAAVGDAIGVIGQQGRGGGGGVTADDELQMVWRLCDQWDDEAAVKVPGPHVVDLEESLNGYQWRHLGSVPKRCL